MSRLSRYRRQFAVERNGRTGREGISLAEPQGATYTFLPIGSTLQHSKSKNRCQANASISNLKIAKDSLCSGNTITNLPYSISRTSLSSLIGHNLPHNNKMDIRILRPSDIPHVQQTNITNLPENYFCKYYMYHALTWPQLSYVAVDVSFTIDFLFAQTGVISFKNGPCSNNVKLEMESVALLDCLLTSKGIHNSKSVELSIRSTIFAAFFA
jgi:hypothetical protein